MNSFIITHRLLCAAFVDEGLFRGALQGGRADVSTVARYLALPIAERPKLSYYFDARYYLARYPDVAEADKDPLLHFLEYGISESRSPHPLIDLHYIAARDPLLLGEPATLDALMDVLEYDLAAPGPYFDPAFYQEALGPAAPPQGLLRHYLTEVHWLGSELSTSAMLVGVPPALQTLADSSPDTNAHRQDEPYRRSLTFMYARLAASLLQLTGKEAARHALPPQQPYPDAQAFLSDLHTLNNALSEQHAQALALPRLRPLIRAVQVFGFQLATVDLRQSSDQHELVVAELFKAAGIETAYLKQNEDNRKRLLLQALNDPRPLRIPGHAYSAHSVSELSIFETARRIRQDHGADAIRHAIISHTETVSDLLEVLLLQKETGLLQGVVNDTAVADLIVVPLFETIEDLQQAPQIMRDYFALPGIPQTLATH